MKNKYILVFLVLLFLPFKIHGKKTIEKDLSLSARDQLEIGRELYGRKKYKKAIVQYKLVIDNYSENRNECAWAQYELAFCHYIKKANKDAIIEFNKILKNYSDIPGPALMAQKMITKIEGKIKEKIRRNERKERKKTKDIDETETDNTENEETEENLNNNE